MSEMIETLPTRRIGTLDIAVLDEDAALLRCRDALTTPGLTRLAFANAHCVNLAARDASYRACLSRFLVLPDGIGVDLGSRLLHGIPFPANLNGTDFVPRLLQADGPALRLALIGGEPGIADTAGKRLAERFPRHRIVFSSDGFFKDAASVASALRAAEADLVLVALGVPRQERFIAEVLRDGDARLAIGVGALLDFIAGKVPRAPETVRRARLEWAYRLAVEPRRLARRYLLGNPAFLVRVVRQKLAGH